MLVLSRRAGESIVIDGHILVTVISACDGRVKMGIDAPDHVRIDRQEIAQRREAGTHEAHSLRTAAVGS